jgi:CheY-like chemotaxis protein
MEEAALYELFSRVPNSNFSHEVLSVCHSDLAVLPVEGLGWTDLGEPERVRSALKVNLGQSDEDLLRGEQRAESDSMIFEQASTQTNQTNSALVSRAKQAYKWAEGLIMFSPSSPPLNMNSSAGHILYVEDNEDTRVLVTYVLALSNYTVVAAENHDDAIRLARAERFDLYLIDHWMVGGSGIELCQKLREFDPQTPIPFYSGVGYERDKQQALAAGAQGYLVKPAENEVLIKEVSRAISAAKENKLESAGREPTSTLTL